METLQNPRTVLDQRNALDNAILERDSMMAVLARNARTFQSTQYFALMADLEKVNARIYSLRQQLGG